MSLQDLRLRGLFIDQNEVLDIANPQLQNPLLFLGLTLSRRCNFKCKYCAQNAGTPAPKELDKEIQCSLIREGKNLGAKSVVIAGAGEPLLDPAFRDVIETAADLGLTTVLYTNGSIITQEMADFLFSHDVSVCVKLDTTNEDRFNALTGHYNSFQLASRGLKNLLAAGYGYKEELADGSRATRLAVNAVVTRFNLRDMVDLALFCHKADIKLFLDNLSITGRASENWKDLVSPIGEFKRVCEDINNTLGYEAVGHSLAREGACILWKYGIVIYLDGEARICIENPADPRIGNISEYSLLELAQKKQSLYPPIPSTSDCPLKCLLRERLCNSLSYTLSQPELLDYFEVDMVEQTNSIR